MADKLNGEFLKKLNDNLRRMETALKDVSSGVKAMSESFNSATGNVKGFVEVVRSIAGELSSLKQFSLERTLEIGDAGAKLSDLHKEITKLKGDLKSGTEGSVFWNDKSSNWKYKKGKTTLTSEEEFAKQERYNHLLEVTTQLEKGRERTLIEIANLKAKKRSKEQQELAKTIAAYNQYAEKYKELGIIIRQETKKDGSLTGRGATLKAEQDKYLALAVANAQEIRKARINGIKLSQEEELRLEVAHQQALRRTQERLNKQGNERAGTKWAQEQRLQAAQTRAAVKEINRLLDERNMREANLAKEGRTEKYYDLQKRKIEEVNRKLEEQKRLLGSYGRSGERALGQLGGRATENSTKQLIEDYKALEQERRRLLKVAEEDAKWQEQQRRNQQAIYEQNGKAIEQQAKLAAQIDEISRKRAALGTKNGNITNMSMADNAYAKIYDQQLVSLREQQAAIEKIYQGSTKAGEAAFAETKALRDAADLRKKEEGAAKSQAQAEKEAAKQVEASQKKIAQAEKESVAVQKRQIDIKNRLRQIDNDRAARAKYNKKATKEEIAAESQEYRHLSQELTKLIARQKELNTISRGSGAKARTQLETYATNQADQAARRYANTLHKLEDEKKRLENTTGKLMSTIQRLGMAFGVAFSVQGLVQFGRKLIETRGEFELQQVALRSILQNKQLADEIWNKTMAAALQSPFTAMQLTRYTKQLAAYRIETSKLFDTTKMLADVSAGLGVDMQRLILAYGQVKAANYLRASEIRQFTEAGVNILGELSTYLSKTRGEFISTAQVMDMVQKRMVKFEDVEAIFKRMTEAGGIFYNMQYVQSQTVKGQINKLHDAYDQMLNAIGKAHSGALKNAVSLMLNIVQNWREWKTVLDSIAIPAIAVSLVKLSKGLLTVGASGKIAAKELRGLELTGARARVSMERLNKSVKSFKLLFFSGWGGAIGIGAAVVAISALVNHAQAVAAENKEITETSRRLAETSIKMSEYSKKIEENNAVLRDSKASAEAHKKAQDDNSELLSKLKSDYPDLSEKMTIHKGIIDGATEALEQYNTQLRAEIFLNEKAKAGFLSESTGKNVKQMQEAEQEYQNTLQNVRIGAIDAIVELNKLLDGADNSTKRAISQIMPLYKQLATAETQEEIEEIVSKIHELNKLSRTDSGELLMNVFRRSIGVNQYQGIFRKKGKLEKKEATLRNEFKDFGKVLVQAASEYGLSQEYADALLNPQNASEEVLKNLQEMLYIVKKDGTVEMGKLGTFLSEIVFSEMDNRGVSTDYAKSFITKLVQTQFKQLTGLDLLLDRNSNNTTNGETDDEKKAKLDAVWRRRINLLEEMKKRYDELSKSAYGYAKSEKEVRDAFDDSFKAIFAGTGISMKQIDFTSMEGMFKSMKLALAAAKGVSDAVKEEIMKKIDSYEARITLDAQVRIREDFGRQMEEALGDYELTLELDKLNLPEGLAAKMWGIEETTLESLRGKLASIYEGLKDENGQLSKEAFDDYKKYLDKIDDLERKQQRERLKDYSKYLEYQYSDRAKMEMEYVRKMAQLEAETALTADQKSTIREGLTKEYQDKVKKQDWEDFKNSEFYVQMMEDLTKQGNASLDLMKKKLLEVRNNAENLPPRALKEVVRALEKIDEIERGRTDPFKRFRDLKKDLKDIDMANVYKELAVQQEQLANYEKEERELEQIIALEQERKRFGEQGVDLEQAKAYLEIAEEALAEAEAEKNMFVPGQGKEDQDRLRVLLENLNAAKEDVEKWSRIVKILSGQATTEQQEQGNPFAGQPLNDLLKRRKELKKLKDETQKNIDKNEEWVNVNKELQLAFAAMMDAINDWAQRVNSVFNDVMDTWEYFSDSTYGMAEAWKELANTTVSALSDTVNGIKAFQEAYSAYKKTQETEGASSALISGDYIKLALVLLGVILKLVQAYAKFGDARQNKEIEKQQEKIDVLTRAYERLEKQLEKTWSDVSYMQTYEELVQNIHDQITALEAQRAAEEAKKNTDKSAVQGYTDSINDLYDQLDENYQKLKEDFGGISDSNFRSVTEGFVDAWKSAFLETGSGLDALQDHFDEFLQDWFVKQAVMAGAGSLLQPVIDEINNAVNPENEGGARVTFAELERVREVFGTQRELLDEFLTNMAGMWNLSDSGSLSGLAAGIQGMTEEQANILEAYWNSVRMYTASIDMNVSRIADVLGVGGVDTNPQLQQLQAIAATTKATNLLLQSASKSGHPQGGVGFKVFND